MDDEVCQQLLLLSSPCFNFPLVFYTDFLNVSPQIMKNQGKISEWNPNLGNNIKICIFRFSPDFISFPFFSLFPFLVCIRNGFYFFVCLFFWNKINSLRYKLPWFFILELLDIFVDFQEIYPETTRVSTTSKCQRGSIVMSQESTAQQRPFDFDFLLFHENKYGK